jgi:O-antigen/teichoic acid export membrane protein
MRIHNSMQNILFGMSGQLISSILGFIVRSVFIYTLGVEYLGIEGLFSSILMMLSLANLGFDNAMIYSLYKPLAEKDQYKIQALINLYRKAYKIVGTVVLVLGLSILPALPFIINGGTSVKNLNIIYLLFLINSVSSYFFVYRQSIIIADQRSHIISKIHSVFIIASNLFQIIILISIKMYILVLITQIVLRVMENIYIGVIAKKLYPYINTDKNIQLSKEDKKIFFKDLYALLLYKISGVVINGTDNIVITKFVGIIWVGIYSNYLLIISTISTFLSHIFYSLTASVGHLNVTESADKKHFVFNVMHFMNFWIYGLCTICLWNLINPFITLWIGEKYILDNFIVFTILLNFYTAGMQNTSTTFRETTGLFKKGKYRPLIAAFINLFVSIILAEKIGLAGVFIGTVFSRLCTFFWYDPYIIYRETFGKPLITYFIKYIYYAIVVSICGVLSHSLGDIIKTGVILHLLIQLILSLSIPNLIFYFLFRNTKEFKYLFGIGKSYVNKVPKRLFVKGV